MTAYAQALHNRVDAVLALAASRRLDADRQEIIEPFAREYFRRLDSDDLAERTPEDLLGALLSHLQLGQEREPGRAKVRVFSPTAGEDGWWSRHSVIEIVNDDMPFLVDSTTMEINRQGLTLHLIVHPIYRRRARRAGQARSRSRRAPESPEAPRESWMHVEVDRLVDAAAARRARRRHRARAGRRARRGAGLEADAGAPAAKRSPNWSTPPAALPRGDRGREPRLPAMAGRRPHHPARLSPARPGGRKAASPRCGSCPAAAWACCARRRREQRSASFAALPPRGARAGRVRRCRCWWSPRPTRARPCTAPGYTDYIGVKRYDDRGRGDRRAPLPRPVHVHRLQRARVRDAAAARQGRGDRRARRPAAGRPPGEGAGPHPRDLSARRAVPDHRRRAVRAPRSASWRSASASGCGCSSGATRSTASSRAWCTCRARPTRPTCGVKFQRILLQAFNGTGADFDVLLERHGAGAHPLHGAHHAGPGAGVRPQGDRAQAGRGGAALGRRAARRADRSRGRGRAASRCSSAGAPPSRPTTASALPARDAVPDVRKLAGAVARRRRWRWRCTGRLGAQPGALGFKVYRLGAPVVLSDSLPMLEHMGVRVLGESS